MSDAPTTAVNPARLQVAFDLVRTMAASKEVPVGLLAVANSRTILRCEAYGPAGPLATDGLYWIASVTKPIVATAIMQLVERGKLLIEDPVASYIPEFAANGKGRVTVWHLLTHTSGLAEDYWRQITVPPTPEWDLRGACASFLRFTPGAHYQYCNVGFTVLGEIVRRVSGLTYQDYLQECIFRPAGMVDTTFRPAASQEQRVVPVRRFPPFPGGFAAFAALALPAGGLFSTAADLVACGQTFLNGGQGLHGRVLGPAAIRTMTSHHTTGVASYEEGPGKPVQWGLGWDKAVPQEGRLTSSSGYGHSGMSGTLLWIEPADDLVVVFLSNDALADGRIRRRVLNTVLAAVECGRTTLHHEAITS